MKRTDRTWIGLGLAAALSACSGGGDGGNAPGGTGTLSVALMDAPVDGVSNLYLQIAGISMKPAGGPPVDLALASAPLTVDLLALTDENAAVLIDGAVVPAGRYQWLEMTVNADHDSIPDSYAIATDGSHHEIRVPSGRVRLVGGFEVGPNEAVEFLFDWDVRKGLVDPPGQSGYLLKPAFRVLEVGEYGVITGRVSATAIADPGCQLNGTDADTGNVVYVFAGASVLPDDLDGTDADGTADAITTAALTQTGTDYEYRAVVPAGTYTVAWTCQAEIDDPEEQDDIEFGAVATDVSVPDALGQATVVVDFL